MWGIALSLNPRNWRLGAVDALDHDISGREIVVGRWYFFGPLAVTYDYQ